MASWATGGKWVSGISVTMGGPPPGAACGTSVTVLVGPKVTAFPIMKSLFNTARFADCDVPKNS